MGLHKRIILTKIDMEVSMKILIMGGTEFVSRNIAEHFIHENYRVDLFTRGKRPISYEGYHTHHVGDRKIIEDLEKLKDIAYDYIIDISAYTKEDVKNLVEHINQSQLKRYIFCSSGAVYEPSDNMISETDARGENNNWLKYGMDKLEAENYLFEQYDKGLPITIFRPTYIYGPHNNLYRESFFFDRISQNKTIFYPKSIHKNQFIHIHDLVLIIESFMASKKANGQAYNVTCESTYSFKSMLDVYKKVTHQKIIIQEVDVEFPSRRYFPYRDVQYTLSIDKLREDNLHIPKFDLESGLKQTYMWYQKNQPNLHDPVMTMLDTLEH